MALGRSIASIDKQLGTLGDSYRQSLDKQRSDVTSQLDSISAALGTFPVAMEASGRLQREVLQLTQRHTIMQASLADAKVAAIGEGGDVKQLDVAIRQKRCRSRGRRRRWRLAWAVDCFSERSSR